MAKVDHMNGINWSLLLWPLAKMTFYSISWYNIVIRPIVVAGSLTKSPFLWVPDEPVQQVPVGGPPSPHDEAGICPMVDFGAFGYEEHPCTSRCSGGIFEKYRTFGWDV